MGKVSNLAIAYAEIKGISFDEAVNVPLEEMQAVVNGTTQNRNTALAGVATDSEGKVQPSSSTLPDWYMSEVNQRKADFTSQVLQTTAPPIPWITIKSYVETALQTTNLTGWTVAILEQSGLAVTWEHCLIEVSVLIPSLSRAQQPLFQIKLFETQQLHETPLAVEFKRHYTGLACACANLLSSVVVRQAISVMEDEWATESAAADAEAEALFDRGEAIAEEQAQLDHEELGI